MNTPRNLSLLIFGLLGMIPRSSAAYMVMQRPYPGAPTPAEDPLPPHGSTDRAARRTMGRATRGCAAKANVTSLDADRYRPIGRK
ncbi:hypothetical protein GCM10011588_60880 [Nocardia jinanensis]|uniref:Uncharacterized protein n=1 Tax=Nocardia jinanensis TaxID=382504 RepID=A0A917VWT5_9NOCA|nr:hypothetical protein GCM10011588_60880 [Nocardia jinanensis]